MMLCFHSLWGTLLSGFVVDSFFCVSLSIRLIFVSEIIYCIWLFCQWKCSYNKTLCFNHRTVGSKNTEFYCILFVYRELKDKLLNTNCYYNEFEARAHLNGVGVSLLPLCSHCLIYFIILFVLSLVLQTFDISSWAKSYLM